MPLRDGSGPYGEGPLTGRGMGDCVPRGYAPRGFRGRRFDGGYGRGYGRRYGAGFGVGYGRRGRYGRGMGYGYGPGPGYLYQEPEDEEVILEEESNYLKSQLSAIQERLEELSVTLEKVQEKKNKKGDDQEK